jgi:hypothetical protein
MKITIKRTEDQLALVRAMGSNNREEAYEAQAAVADLLLEISTLAFHMVKMITLLCLWIFSTILLMRITFRCILSK